MDIKNNPMIQFVAFGDKDSVKKLISLRYDVNVQNEEGMYPALMAAQRNDLNMLNILIEAGAKMDLLFCEKNITPRYWAEQNKNAEMIKAIDDAINKTNNSSNNSKKNKR